MTCACFLFFFLFFLTGCSSYVCRAYFRVRPEKRDREEGEDVSGKRKILIGGFLFFVCFVFVPFFFFALMLWQLLRDRRREGGGEGKLFVVVVCCFGWFWCVNLKRNKST